MPAEPDGAKDRPTGVKRLLAIGIAMCAVVSAPLSGSAHAASGKTVPTVSTPPSTREQLRSALRAWANFPVHASPRPLVLMASPVSAPSTGFPTEDAKEAFLSGALEAPGQLPAGPPESEGYPVVSAVEALATIRSEGSPALGAPEPPTPLVIGEVRLGTSSFGTDRGPRVLPAWLFTFSGLQDPAAVLAVAPAEFFEAPASVSTVGARLRRDGRTVTVTFVGGAPGTGPCTKDYAVDQLASRTAVAVSVRELPRPEVGASLQVCRTLGYPRQERIVLASPLGNRVLVDATTKGPVAVAK